MTNGRAKTNPLPPEVARIIDLLIAAVNEIEELKRERSGQLALLQRRGKE